MVTRHEIGELNRTFHASPEAWKLSWQGVPLYKYPTDLQVHREIIEQTRPDVIVETGVHAGGSLLFFASVLDDLQIDGQVVGVDVDLSPVADAVRRHPRVTLVEGDSASAAVVARVEALAAGGRVMVVLDSDHSTDHVLDELRSYSGLVTPGCYLVVEDTTVDVFGVHAETMPGPFDAIERWFVASPPFDVDDSRDRFLLTTSPCGRLRRRSTTVTVREIPGDRPRTRGRTAFAVPIGAEATWERYARPGIARSARPGDVVIELRDNTCLFAAGNAAFDAALEVDDLGALVIQHDDVELDDAAVGAKLRAAFAEPGVGIAGVIGGRSDEIGMEWWAGAESIGHVGWRLPDPHRRFGTDAVVTDRTLGQRGSVGRVDALDGLFLAFSPTAVRQLRFDEALGPSFHGYDVDICLQARTKGLGAVVVDVACTHHNNADYPYLGQWAAQHARFEAKWSARRPQPAERPSQPA